MERRRLAAILVASLLVASTAIALLLQPRSEPRERVLVTLEDERIHACFYLFLVDEQGDTTRVPVPCVDRPNPALPGTYSGGADVQILVALTFLERGNTTCPGWYYDRYNVFYGAIQSFALEAPVSLESWEPRSMDLIYQYGEIAQLVIRMPDTSYQGPLNLTLYFELQSYEWEPRCPPD